MYLKRLEMLGFKSFAARTLLEFSTGITAVIGPNGAGKSNVADAVRWVLGEQSMRQLRGKKSDDIIFSGGYGKAALGMAEVSLTIDNSTGWVPSEYSEITVTRRSFRSGENEYLINKQKVRLKDVLLLLAQARIGHDSYTVVGQGLIDAALSLRAEERRGLFEDAAGIRPFQVQRVEAESRLRQTAQNLDRLRDIVSEIEPRLAHLAEQANRAIEFGQLHSQLQQILLTWYTLQWQYLSAISERVEATEHKQAQQINQIEQDLHRTDEQREGLRIIQQSLQARSSTARTAHTQASENTQKTERELAVNQERITGLQHQRSQQQQLQLQLHERLLVAQQRTIDYEEQSNLASEAVNTHIAALVTLEAQVAAAQKDYELNERRLRTMQSELIQVGARLGASQTDVGRQQKHLGERNRTLATRRESIAQSQQLLRTLQTRQIEERTSLATVRSEEQQVLQRKQALVRTISDTQQEIEHLKATVAEAERQHRSISDRLNMLKNWRQSLSGYSDAVRALLRAPATKLTGLIGPIPQLSVAPAGLEIALEAALGPNLQAVAVQTPADAYTCLHYLQTVEAGKAIIVWLEAGQEEATAVRNALPQEAALNRFLEEHCGQLQKSPEATSASLPHPPPSSPLQAQILGLAWRHVNCEQRHLPLFQKILQGIVLVKDLATAQALLASLVSHTSDIHLQALVTLSGEVLYINGWLIGGSSKHSPQQGLLAYERELRELPQQLHDQKALMDQVHSKIHDLQRSQETRRIEQATLDKELQKLASRLSGLNKAIDSTQRERMRLETEVQLAASIEQQLTAEIAGLEQEVQAAHERVQAHEKSQRELAALLEQVEQEVAQRTIAYRHQQDELGQTRTTLALKRQEATSLRQQLQTLSAQAQELNAQLEQQVVHITQTEQQEQALLETVIQHRTQLEQAQARTRTFADELHVVEAEVAEIAQQTVALEQQTLQMRHTLSELEIAYRRCLLESQKARDAIDTLLEQLHEEMDIASPHDLVSNGQVIEPAEEGQLRRLRREADSLRSRLKTLGGCDPDAPQQYQETRTRFEFLTSQIADMQQAALHLHTIIEQLDVTMAKQFDITFQAVNARFREHFITLFHGGNARLELITPKRTEDDTIPLTSVEAKKPGELLPLADPPPYTASNMPAGVEVIVQPPGKKVQDLSLLSGGERALVSAALLFALLEINPPPFCLLDEVDAALDESNVTRFCDILKQLAQHTQFIVITHNQSTMAASQVLYGVSMSKDSSSRLLSLKLEEATK